MKTPKFTGPFQWGSVRKQLLSLRDDVKSVQKTAGKNIDIDVHPGKGTVLHAIRKREEESPPIPTGACCVEEDCSITTEAECEAMEGVYQGDDVPCDPDPCVLAICECLAALGYHSVTMTVHVTGTDTTFDCDVTIDETFTKTWIGVDATCDNDDNESLPEGIEPDICNRESFDDGGHHYDDSASGFIEAGYNINCLANTMDLNGAISLLCAFCVDGDCEDRSHSPCGRDLNAFRIGVAIGNHSFSDNFTGSEGGGSYDYTIEVSISFS